MFTAGPPKAVVRPDPGTRAIGKLEVAFTLYISAKKVYAPARSARAYTPIEVNRVVDKVSALKITAHPPNAPPNTRLLPEFANSTLSNRVRVSLITRVAFAVPFQ